MWGQAGSTTSQLVPKLPPLLASGHQGASLCSWLFELQKPREVPRSLAGEGGDARLSSLSTAETLSIQVKYPSARSEEAQSHGSAGSRPRILPSKPTPRCSSPPAVPLWTHEAISQRLHKLKPIPTVPARPLCSHPARSPTGAKPGATTLLAVPEQSPKDAKPNEKMLPPGMDQSQGIFIML